MKLQLHAQTTNWERFKMRKASEKFKLIRPRIITRDQRTCQYCQYSGPDLEVVNADFNYAHNHPDNLVTACSLCAKVHFLDAYEMTYTGPDRMIYLPELTQIELHHVLRVLFCKSKQSGESSYNAKMLLAQFQDRITWLDEKVGTQLSHPAVFANYLNQSSANAQLLARIRWLPGIESYEELIPEWSDVLNIK
jgi:intracellular multiplication protein IcmJ